LLNPCVALGGQSAEGRGAAISGNIGPKPLALGPPAGMLVVTRKLDSSANIWRSQAT